MGCDIMVVKEKMISLEKAQRQMEMVCKRLALLHLAFAKTLVKEFGEEQGEKLTLKAIKRYGQLIGEEAKKKVIGKGLEPVPENYKKGEELSEIGMHSGRETLLVDGQPRSRAYGCVMGKVWNELGKGKLGRLYCYVDPAKYMAFNPKYKLSHIKALPDGDKYCELAVKETTEQERIDFADIDADWQYIDR
jgi:hypothetical protein